MVVRLELILEGPTLELEDGSPLSTFEISSFFPMVEKETQFFEDVCSRQHFAFVFYFTPLLVRSSSS